MMLRILVAALALAMCFTSDVGVCAEVGDVQRPPDPLAEAEKERSAMEVLSGYISGGVTSRKKTVAAIDFLFDKGLLRNLVHVLPKQGNIDVCIMIVRKLSDADNPSIVGELLSVWHSTPKSVDGSEAATLHRIYMGEMLLLIGQLTGQEIAVDEQALIKGPAPESQEAAAIIANAEAWWAENSHLYVEEAPENGTLPSVRVWPNDTRPQPQATTAPGTAPLEQRSAEDSAGLWPLWIGATALCIAIAAGAIYLSRRRKRGAA